MRGGGRGSSRWCGEAILVGLVIRGALVLQAGWRRAAIRSRSCSLIDGDWRAEARPTARRTARPTARPTDRPTDRLAGAQRHGRLADRAGGGMRGQARRKAAGLCAEVRFRLRCRPSGRAPAASGGGGSVRVGRRRRPAMPAIRPAFRRRAVISERSLRPVQGDERQPVAVCPEPAALHRERGERRPEDARRHSRPPGRPKCSP